MDEAMVRRAQDPSIPSDEPEVDEVVSLIGPKLAALRKTQKLSLQQLAVSSDVSAAAIHKIERNGMVPTITTLLKLAKALGVAVNHFVEEDLPQVEPVHLTRTGSKRAVYTPHRGLVLHGITGSYRHFQLAGAEATIRAGATSGEKMLEHPGEELVRITEGSMTFVLGSDTYELNAGDALHFSGDVPHSWINGSGKVAKAIWVALRG
jgi:transcriptional regulator with XRE-family HTH domain